MTSPELHVRACPEQLELAETYRYRFDVATASSFAAVGPPMGRLRGLFPYQASEWYSLRAAGDLERQVATEGRGDLGIQRMATVGHLVFANWERTDLEARMPATGGSGTEALRIPASACRRFPGGDSAVHRQAALVELEYLPETPEVVPLRIDAEIMDRETLDAQQIAELTRRDEPDMSELGIKLARRAEESTGLLLVLELSLTLDDTRVGGVAGSPYVNRVMLRWPTIPWAGSLALVERHGSWPTCRTFRYSPESRSVEWAQHVPLKRQRHGGDDERKEVDSSWRRRLVIVLDEVADLAGASRLECEVEVHVPGALISGLGVRHYDATGALVTTGPQLKTSIIAELGLGLEHLLRRQTRAIVHRLFLQGVLLDERRVADVCNAFADCGLRVRRRWRGDGGTGAAVVVGERLVEGAPLHLIARLEGHRHSAVRTTELTGGRSYRTKLATGDVDLTLHGLLRGSNEALCAVVDAVHRRLRDVFNVTADHR